jgi:hypothetical protein
VSVTIRRGTDRDVQFGQRLTSVLTGMGLPSIDDLSEELRHYVDVLMGREPSPVDSPYLSLQEVATAYHSRACEIEMVIHRGEREGLIPRGSEYYRFRTGELRDFIELAKKCAELGSRRLTQETLLAQARLER